MKGFERLKVFEGTKDGRFACLGPVVAVIFVILAGLWHGGDVAAGAAGAGADWLNSWYRRLFFLVILGLFLAFFLFSTHKRGKERWDWLAFSLILYFGSLYLFVLAPLSAPDEIAHFMNSYRMSSVLLFDEPVDEEGYIKIREADDFIQNIYQASGDEERISIGKLLDEEAYELLHNEWKKGFFAPADARQMISSVYRPIETTPLAHIPQAAGIAAARLFGFSGVALLYIGRFANLLFFSGACFWAMRLLPFGKPVLLGVALLPMTLHQAASYSYDVFVTALYFLFAAYCLRLAFTERQVKKRDIAFLAAAIAALGPCKFVYAAVLGFALLIPVRKFGGKKNWALAAAAVFGAYAAAMVLVNAGMLSETFGFGGRADFASDGELEMVVGSDAGADTLSDTNFIDWAGEPGYEAGYFLHNPGALVRIFYESLAHQGDEWFLGIMGSQLGILDPVLSVPFIVIFAMAVCLAMLSVRKAGEALYLTGIQKAWILFVSAATVGGVMLSMLLAWTPVSSKVIEGVQGRYFLPMLPFVLMTIPSERLARTEGNDERILFYLCAMEAYVLLRLFSIVSMRL